MGRKKQRRQAEAAAAVERMKMKVAEPMGWQRLPKELKEDVLGRLGLRDRFRLPRVCREWQAILGSKALWKKVERVSFEADRVRTNVAGLGSWRLLGKKGRLRQAGDLQDCVLGVVSKIRRASLKALELRSLGTRLVLTPEFVDRLAGLLAKRRVQLKSLVLGDLLVDGAAEAAVRKSLGRLLGGQTELGFLAVGPLLALQHRPRTLASQPLRLSFLSRLASPELRHLVLTELDAGDDLVDMEGVVEQLGGQLDALWLSFDALNDHPTRAGLARALKLHAPGLRCRPGQKLGFVARFESDDFIHPLSAAPQLHSAEYLSKDWAWPIDLAGVGDRGGGEEEDGEDSEDEGEAVGYSGESEAEESDDSLGSLEDFIRDDVEELTSETGSSSEDEPEEWEKENETISEASPSPFRPKAKAKKATDRKSRRRLVSEEEESPAPKRTGKRKARLVSESEEDPASPLVTKNVVKRRRVVSESD